MNLFSIIPELMIGSIIEVSGTSIRLELDINIAELTRTYGGKVYPIGQFASVIKIHFGRTVLLAYVRLLRMRSELALEEGRPIPAGAEDSRIIDADLFGEGVWNSEDSNFRFKRGVSNYPLPGQAVYLTTQDELTKIYEGAEKKMKDGTSPMVPIGYYIGSARTTCYANLDKLFAMHCAVLGSTGSGKSGTVAAIVHSILEHKCSREEKENNIRPRVIIIDPHGEYSKAFKNRCIIFRAYNILANDEEQNTVQLKLPYWLMTGEEFRDLVIGKSEWEATSENNIVYKALHHSRLVNRGLIEQSKNWKGENSTEVIPEENRPLKKEDVELISGYDRDTPDPFQLKEFVKHIKMEQAIRIKSGKWEEMSPSDIKSYLSVLDKLNVLRTDPRLFFMMKDYEASDPDLPEILQQFIGYIKDESKKEIDIRIIDISGLPNEIAGPLTATVARLLFQYKTWQTRKERERDPVLIICEEAHRYVPDTGLAEYQSAQKAIRRLAKEGRKYGIGLMLVSQRPADVERTVLSQCNSWIVMRLTNSTDQEHVAKYLPDNLAGLSKLLPSLSRQEAIFVGEAAAIPARIFIRTLNKDQLPNSNDISFVKGWSDGPIEKEKIEAVVKRWRKETIVDAPSS